MKKPKTSRTKPRRSSSNQKTREQMVHFEFLNPDAQKVCIAGSFNGWEPESCQMIQYADGKWGKALMLKPGTYEYRLVVDGSWTTDPKADHAIMNPFGERNSLVTVST